MVDKTNGVGPITNQTFSKKGVKLSELKENKLLFDYFKKAGLDEHSYVFESDIEKIKEAYDKNENGKLSKKEARAIFGEDVSRKELRKAVKGMKEIAKTEIKDTIVEVKTGENTFDKYDKNGNILSSRIEEPKTGAYTEVFFADGDKTKVKMSKIKDDQDCTVTTTYANGDVNKPEQIIQNDKGKVTITDYKYHGDNLVSTLTKDGNTITEVDYNKDGTSCATITNPDGSVKVVNYDKDGNVVKEPEKQPEVKPETKPETKPDAPVNNKPAGKAKISIPENWGKVPRSTRMDSGITETKNAQDSAEAFLKHAKIDEKAVDKEKFVKDLIKFNPSIYDEKGNVKANAKWDKLDLPNKVADQYKAAEDENKAPENKKPVPTKPAPIDPSLDGVPDPKDKLNKKPVQGEDAAKQPVQAKTNEEILAEKHKEVQAKRAELEQAFPNTSNQVKIKAGQDGFVYEYQGKTYNTLVEVGRAIDPNYAKPKTDKAKDTPADPILEKKQAEVAAKRAELEQAFPNSSNHVKIKANKDGGFVYEYQGKTYNTLVEVGRAIDPNYAKPKAIPKSDSEEDVVDFEKRLGVPKFEPGVNAENKTETTKAAAKPDPKRVEELRQKLADTRAYIAKQWPDQAAQISVKLNKGNVEFDYKGKHYEDFASLNEAIKKEPPVLTKKK